MERYRVQKSDERRLCNAVRKPLAGWTGDRTLKELHIGSDDYDDIGHKAGVFLTYDRAGFLRLGDAIGNNRHLSTLRYHKGLCSHIIHALELAMSGNAAFFEGIKRNSSINKFELRGCGVSQGVGWELVTSFHENNNSLTQISLSKCSLRNRSMDILASTLRKCTHIQEIVLSHSHIEDDGVEALISSVRSIHKLEMLHLGHNNIGRAGFEALASYLEDPRCNLVTLDLTGNHSVDDDSCVTVFANVLKNNNTLESLAFPCNSTITESGWTALFKALWDTSSISETYLSNHTLNCLGFGGQTPTSLQHFLWLNRGTDKKQVAIKKILHGHPHYFHMKSFFEWDMKLLPIIMNWFGRARACTRYNEAWCVELRMLDAAYQFMRAVPREC